MVLNRLTAPDSRRRRGRRQRDDHRSTASIDAACRSTKEVRCSSSRGTASLLKKPSRSSIARAALSRCCPNDRVGAAATSAEQKNVGSYRRALSSYDVKVEAVPLLSLAVDEPSAYELMASVPAVAESDDRGEPA